MRITYDPEADALYIELKDTEAEDNIDLREGVTADLDVQGNIIAIEILDARRRYGDSLESLSFERLVGGAAEQAPAAAR